MSTTAKITFDGDNKPLLDKLNQIDQRFAAQKQTVEGLGSSLGAAAIGAGLVVAALKTIDMARLGAEIAHVDQAFQRLTGNAVAGLAQLRNAVNGTLDDFRLKKFANDALNKGLSFDEVVKSLQYAKLVADETGREFEITFNRISTGISRVKQGSSDTSIELSSLGINARTLTSIMADMDSKIKSVGDNLNNTNDKFFQWDANLTNVKHSLAEIARQLTGGQLERLAILFQILQGKGLTGPSMRSLSNIDDVTSQEQSARSLIHGITEEFATQGATVERLSQVKSQLNDISEKAQGLSVKDQQAITNFNQALQNQIDLLSTQIKPNQAQDNSQNEAELSALQRLAEAETPLAQIYAKIEQLRTQQKAYTIGTKEYLDLQIQINKALDQETEIEQRNTNEATKNLKEELANKLNLLVLEREEIKAKIALGQASYADLKELIDKQQALQITDKNFQIGLLNDLGEVYKNSATQKDKSSAEILNRTLEYSDLILRDETKTNTQRLIARLQFLRESFQLEQNQNNLSREDKKTLYEAEYRAEQELKQNLEQLYRERTEFIRSALANTFGQFTDDLLDGNLKSFDKYLKDLTKLILKFLIQKAIMAFLSLLFGGPAALVGDCSAAEKAVPVDLPDSHPSDPIPLTPTSWMASEEFFSAAHKPPPLSATPTTRISIFRPTPKFKFLPPPISSMPSSKMANITSTKSA